MSRRGDPLWDLSGPEYEFDEEAEKLIRDYEIQTEIIKNQTELLAMLIKGMRQ